jgi:hypothetical protein
VAAFAPVDGFAERPTLSGQVENVPSADGLFLFHFTRTGVDAVAPRDVDPQNGLPDYVDDVIDGVRVAYDAWVTNGGWPAPAGDDGEGGDDRIDVYIKLITCEEASGVTSCGPGGTIPSFLFGITRGERFIGGSTHRLTSYILINPANDIPLGRNFARSVAAHELHHVIQFALDAREPRWVYEATAAYMQLELFDFIRRSPYVVDALLLDRLGKPEASLASREGRIEYSNALWFRYLADRFGDPDIVRAIWADAGSSRDERLYAAFETALAPHGMTFASALAEWGEWNYFSCGRDDGHHYESGFACVSAHTSVRVDASYDRYPVTEASLAHPPEPMGMAYVELRPDGASRDLVVDFAGDAATPWRLSLLRVRNDCTTDAVTVPVDASGRATTRVDGVHAFRAVTLLAVNTSIQGAVAAPARYSVRGEGVYEGPLPAASRTLERLEMFPAAMTLGAAGDAAEIVALARYSDCTSLNVSRDPQTVWQSSDPSVVAVDGSGNVTAVGVGRAAVVAYHAGRASPSVNVQVGDPPAPPPPSPPPRGGCGTVEASVRMPLFALLFAWLGVRGWLRSRRRRPGRVSVSKTR